MSATYDDCVFSASNEENSTEFTFKNRYFSELPDTNNGSYSGGHIKYDLANLSNSGHYTDWKSTYADIPLTIEVRNSGNSFFNTASVENALSVSLKNGSYQLINSISTTLGNILVTDPQDLTNLHINYKILTSWSPADVQAQGSSMHFGKDTNESLEWDTVAGEINCNIGGKGVGNVTGTTAFAGGINAIPQNAGRLKRMLEGTALCADDTTLARFTNESHLTASKKSYCKLDTDVIYFYIMAQIPMRYLHDLFEKMPLTKGSLVKLDFTTHAPCSVQFEVGATGAITAITPSINRDFCPFMITKPSNDAGSGFKLVAEVSTVTASISIGNPMQENCRLMVCMYEMNPIYESLYLKESIKRVTYNDFFMYRSTNTANINANFSQTLSSSLANLRRLVILPFTDSTANGSSQLDPLVNPFSSAGGTMSSPYAYMTNLQVLLSGVPLYPQPISYRYQQFLQEINGWNSMNGGLNDGLRNCLISEADFNGQYGAVSINLQRHSQDSDSVPKSVQINFKNETSRKMNYIFYLVYEKYFDVDVGSGQIVIGRS